MVGRLRSAAAACAAAALAGCAGDREPPPAQTPRGFEAVVRDDTRTRPDGLVRWSAEWELSWQPVPGASGYLVYVTTAEGAGGEARRIAEPRWSINVANGVDPLDDVRTARDQQLALLAAQLEVRVAARYPDDRTSRRSPPFPVGEPVG